MLNKLQGGFMNPGMRVVKTEGSRVVIGKFYDELVLKKTRPHWKTHFENFEVVGFMDPANVKCWYFASVTGN